MRRRLTWFVVASALVCALASHAQQSNATKPAAPPKQKESFWEWVLRFSGVSANPSTLKGGEDDLLSGQVWVADLPSGARRKITTDGGYRSPVYYPNCSDVLTLQGGYLVRISSSGQPAKLYSAGGITKLIGFSVDGPEEVLALKEDEAGRVSPARLSTSTGKVIPLPYDPQSSRDRQMLEHLQDWQRSYGDTALYVKRESREALSGTVEVLNVFVRTPARDPQNVSGCETASCGQPSLSPDGKRVLFIKAVL